jgi:hypothetical protein
VSHCKSNGILSILTFHLQELRPFTEDHLRMLNTLNIKLWGDEKVKFKLKV